MNFFSRPRSALSSRFRPTFETLEERDCLSSISLSVAELSQRHVSVSGLVSDPNPGGRIVQLSGVCTGSITTNADGSYSTIVVASSLGTIQAALTNGDGGQICAAQAQLTSRVPAIASFQATRGFNNGYTFSGQVNDEWPPGLVVTLNGFDEIHNLTTTVGQNNCFSVGATLHPGDTGLVSAQVSDWWGQASIVVQIYLST